MLKQLEILASYDIPTTHYISGIGFLVDQDDLTPIEYHERIKELTGDDIKFDNEYLYKTYYLYLVQEIIRASMNPLNELVLDDIKDLVLKRSLIFIKNHPWVSRKYQMVEDENGVLVKPKRRKGGKKEKAIALWREKGGIDNGMKRKDWIDLLMKEVDMSKGGASTYYQNLKSGLYS